MQSDVCLEHFPSVKADVSGVCDRCRGDPEEVKLYSAANNMDPGGAPSELGVSHKCLCYTVSLQRKVIFSVIIIFSLFVTSYVCRNCLKLRKC